jgi:transcription elongation factor GreA
MSRTTSRIDRSKALAGRLAALQLERKQVLAEIAPVGMGDDADRATNVDGHVRLAMIEERIAIVEAELAEADLRRRRAADGTVTVGDLVTVDLGEGPETFLLGSVDEATDGLDVITPSSPLGKVLQGASIGSTVSYAARPGRSLQARVIGVA